MAPTLRPNTLIQNEIEVPSVLVHVPPLLYPVSHLLLIGHQSLSREESRSDAQTTLRNALDTELKTRLPCWQRTC
jgi:hypothetical protein